MRFSSVQSPASKLLLTTVLTVWFCGASVSVQAAPGVRRPDRVSVLAGAPSESAAGPRAVAVSSQPAGKSQKAAAASQGGSARDIFRQRPLGPEPMKSRAVPAVSAGGKESSGLGASSGAGGFSDFMATPLIGVDPAVQAALTSLDLVSTMQDVGGVRDMTKDPLGDWLEKNADKMRLFVDSAARDSQNPKKTFVPPTGVTSEMDPALQVAAVIADMRFNKKCTNFAGKDGLGPYGKVIVQEIVGGRYENVANLLHGGDDFKQFCPRFDRLNTNEKAHVYVLLFAAMSFLESSCNPNSGHTSEVLGPNGFLGGLLQLHKGNEHKYAPSCARKASESPAKSLTCAISMLNTQLANQDNRIFAPKSYWDVLRPRTMTVMMKTGKTRKVQLAKTVAGSIRELALCQDN